MAAVVGHIVRMRRNAHAVVLPFVNDRIGIFFLSVCFLTFWAWDDHQVFWMEAVEPPFLSFFPFPSLFLSGCMGRSSSMAGIRPRMSGGFLNIRLYYILFRLFLLLQIFLSGKGLKIGQCCSRFWTILDIPLASAWQ